MLQRPCPMNIEVRAANVSDLDAICRLLILLFEQEADFEPDYERQACGVRAIFSHSERGRFFVVTESGHVVGVVNLQFLESTALGGRVDGCAQGVSVGALQKFGA